MSSYEEDYYLALEKCGRRYSIMQSRNMDSGLDDFVAEYCRGVRDRLPIPKLCRWLGFIQASLIDDGLTTVEEERNWTRPLFRPLDFGE